ncbi:MAG TPA: serine hydrolase [Solirubrobacterales bacterium]|nr:serine hydrolase [Solirubrobacterales bacterium]
MAAIGALLFAFAAAIIAIAIWPESAGNSDTQSRGPHRALSAAGGEAANGIAGDPGTRSRQSIGTFAAKLSTAERPGDARFALQPVAGPLPVRYRFKHPPIAGVLFDLKSGQILWQRNPRLKRPIASLTKMMTALMVARTDSPDERVRVSRNAAHTQGSATGLLPRGRKVPLEALLEALILISANDAAVALAEHDGGSVPHFIKEMNATARAMGLTCTHFTTPNGLRDRGNYSCPRDLAALARADLANKRIAGIVQTRSAKPRFPIKGKRLYLTNNHYFLQHGIGVPGAEVTGVKTGFTDAAGSCYVTTARLGSHHLGLVLLHSPSPLTQVPALLRAGFVEVGAIAPTAPAPPVVPPTG